jgi:hypothetical protein
LGWNKYKQSKSHATDTLMIKYVSKFLSMNQDSDAQDFGEKDIPKQATNWQTTQHTAARVDYIPAGGSPQSH